MPALRHGEGDEDADGVEREQLVGLALEDDEEHAGQPGQDDDAVGEHEAIALGGELAGNEPVAGQEEGQPREVGERRVGRQQQDEHGHGLDLVVHEPVAEDAAGDLRDDGLVAAGDDAEVVGQVGDAEEHHHRDAAEPRHDDARVVRFGRLEGRHAVGYGLHAGERGAPRRERPQEQKEADAFQARRMRRVGRLRQAACRRLAHAQPDHDEDAGDEEIGGQREDLARLADASAGWRSRCPRWPASRATPGRETGGGRPR